MGRVRPIFQRSSTLPPEEVVKRVGRSLKRKNAPVNGVTAPGRIELQVVPRQVHLWSPQLIVDVSIEGESCKLHGRFGPHPSVWTMYMAGYAACAFLFLLGFSFAFAQWTMEEPPWALVALPLSLLGAGLLYGLAFVGQKRGHDQMLLLEKFLHDEISRHESEPPAPSPEKAPAHEL